MNLSQSYNKIADVNEKFFSIFFFFLLRKVKLMNVAILISVVFY